MCHQENHSLLQSLMVFLLTTACPDSHPFSKAYRNSIVLCAILSLTFVAPKPEAANLPEICGLWSVLEVIDGGIQSIITAVVVIELCVLRVGEVGVERISIIQAIIRVGETRDHVVICNTQK